MTRIYIKKLLHCYACYRADRNRPPIRGPHKSVQVRGQRGRKGKMQEFLQFYSGLYRIEYSRRPGPVRGRTGNFCPANRDLPLYNSSQSIFSCR